MSENQKIIGCLLEMLMIYISFMFTYISIFIYGIGIFVIFAVIAVVAASSDLIMRAATGRGFI